MPGQTGRRLRRHDRGEDEADGEAQAVEQLRQDRRQHEVAHGLESGGAERLRGQQPVAGDAAGAGHDRQRDRCQTGEEEQPDLRGVTDPEPQDQQAEVRQRRQRPQEVDVGLDEDPEPAHGRQQQPERHADDDRPEQAPQDASHARPPVLPEVVVLQPALDDREVGRAPGLGVDRLLEPSPDRAGRRDELRVDPAGTGDDPPGEEEHRDGEHAHAGPTGPSPSTVHRVIEPQLTAGPVPGVQGTRGGVSSPDLAARLRCHPISSL